MLQDVVSMSGTLEYLTVQTQGSGLSGRAIGRVLKAWVHGLGGGARRREIESTKIHK